MSGARIILLGTLAALSFAAVSEPALADRWDRERDRGNRHYDRWEDWDNRRDARRAGVIAGTVAAEVAAGAARANAREEYEECMELYARDFSYDRYCREEYYRDRAAGRRAARRTGVVVGLGVREIVRD
jgi:Ni/Co efflux regulator RcnB